MTTSTGSSRSSGRTRTLFTEPTSTPAARTVAPSRRPEAFVKYAFTVNLCPIGLARRRATKATTISPTTQTSLRMFVVTIGLGRKTEPGHHKAQSRVSHLLKHRHCTQNPGRRVKTCNGLFTSTNGGNGSRPIHEHYGTLVSGRGFQIGVTRCPLDYEVSIRRQVSRTWLHRPYCRKICIRGPAGGSGEVGSASIWTQVGPKLCWETTGASRMYWCRRSYWSGRADLNRGPPAPKAGALPGCATPRHY